METQNKTNANNELSGYTGSEQWHKYGRLMITEGGVAFAEKNQCYWFLDIISSYQQQLVKAGKHEFQQWKIEKNKTGSGAKVTCDDGNKKILITQRIPFTDFPHHEGTLWVENNVILLPSEH